MPATDRISFFRLMWEFVRRDIKIALSYRLQAFFQAASVLSICVTFFFVSLMMRNVEGNIDALDKYGGRYFGFVLIGIAFSTYLDAALRAFATAIRTAQITGTLEAMLATPTRIGPLIAGSAVYPLLFTTIRVVLFLIFGVFVFRLHVSLDAWPGAVLVLLLTVTSSMALGIFASGFIVLYKQGDPVTAAIAGLSWLLSGVLYPKEILPTWVQRIADFLPMTHTLESMRLVLLTGMPIEDLGRSLAYLGAFSLLGIPLSVVWFAWAVNRARIAGSLATY